MENVLIAKVAVSAATYAIDKPYDYLIPPSMAEKAVIGMRVIVPFGRGNKLSDGILLSIGPVSSQLKLKQITALLDEHPVLDGESVRLALWMRERYFCTVYDAVKAMLPSGLWYALQNEYAVAPGWDRDTAYAEAGKSAAATRILDLLFDCGGKAKLRKIKAVFGAADPSSALRGLVKKEILTVKTHLSRGVGDKTTEILKLATPPDEALKQSAKKIKKAPMRYAVAELLSRLEEAPLRQISYLTGASASALRAMVKSGFLISESREEFRRPAYKAEAPAAPVVLNQEQVDAFQGIDALCRAGKPAAALLYGVTGSGKTKVYLKLIAKTLARGKSAMLLVPEIALTSQLLQMASSSFGNGVALLHSSLRAGERYDEWKRIRSGEARVVVGTRSAIFAPLQNLGLLILDEEQEYTYKSESAPRYHARDVAKYRCMRSGAVLLLGSATPSVESFYYAKQGIYHLFTLHRRYNEGTLPEVMVVDMRKELHAGNGGTISLVLRRELAKNIGAGRQSILLMNRRGNRPMVTCGECGDAPVCPHCRVYLTYHSANGRLMCHHCGHSQALPPACPKCGGQLKFIGAGTQKVQEELEALFPDVEILRMDTDSVSAAGSHEKILSRFEKKEIPILLGTQMVAKGLDFENVTLVGVISAALSLY
ncbi:MAG: primosomal protein N', partial [Oscillospiraceae bacterium]|nr:primosomal protein N' [Oscillospiraceae bacterium]